MQFSDTTLTTVTHTLTLTHSLYVCVCMCMRFRKKKCTFLCVPCTQLTLSHKCFGRITVKGNARQLSMTDSSSVLAGCVAQTGRACDRLSDFHHRKNVLKIERSIFGSIFLFFFLSILNHLGDHEWSKIMTDVHTRTHREPCAVAHAITSVITNYHPFVTK